MSEPKSVRSYTSDEVAAILARALERQNGEGGRISHDELLETAREIGVTTAEMEAVIADETRVRAERAQREADRRQEVARLGAHVVAFVGVGSAAYLAARSSGASWVAWVLVVWAVGVAVHAVRTLTRREG